MTQLWEPFVGLNRRWIEFLSLTDLARLALLGEQTWGLSITHALGYYILYERRVTQHASYEMAFGNSSWRR